MFFFILITILLAVFTFPLFSELNEQNDAHKYKQFIALSEKGLSIFHPYYCQKAYLPLRNVKNVEVDISASFLVLILTTEQGEWHFHFEVSSFKSYQLIFDTLQTWTNYDIKVTIRNRKPQIQEWLLELNRKKGNVFIIF
ncbi:hypothetical protein [Hugenholtzia roseola]|uniref:hypothetical protein n=1 Tax=Hugenholtzia roseola TaxID=1002 RepID=UPI0004017B0F|nr:hypothetical protein [Hugenholtzia roseola]